MVLQSQSPSETPLLTIVKVEVMYWILEIQLLLVHKARMPVSRDSLSHPFFSTNNFSSVDRGLGVFQNDPYLDGLSRPVDHDLLVEE